MLFTKPLYCSWPKVCHCSLTSPPHMGTRHGTCSENCLCRDTVGSGRVRIYFLALLNRCAWPDFRPRGHPRINFIACTEPTRAWLPGPFLRYCKSSSCLRTFNFSCIGLIQMFRLHVEVRHTPPWDTHVSQVGRHSIPAPPRNAFICHEGCSLGP